MTLSLPPELILHIIDFFITPCNEGSAIAYPPTHPTTRTLLSLTQTCRIAYPTALRALFKQCCWIDSPHRLNRLGFTIQELSDRWERSRLDSSLDVIGLPPVAILSSVQSLYLAPFAHGSVVDRPAARLIRKLLPLLAPYLRRLLVDLPLRDYCNLRGLNKPYFADEFVQLTALEVFCSVRDEIPVRAFLSLLPPLVWFGWSSLHTLALYNVDTSEDFWQHVCSLERLKHLILTRADGLDDVDIVRVLSELRGKDKSPLTITLVNVESDHLPLVTSELWKHNGNIVIKRSFVPVSYYGDENPISSCQEWTMNKFREGKYEDIEGEVITHQG